MCTDTLHEQRMTAATRIWQKLQATTTSWLILETAPLQSTAIFEGRSGITSGYCCACVAKTDYRMTEIQDHTSEPGWVTRSASKEQWFSSIRLIASSERLIHSQTQGYMRMSDIQCYRKLEKALVVKQHAFNIIWHEKQSKTSLRHAHNTMLLNGSTETQAMTNCHGM